jgi:FKBP-type peptidyl-prolyl cis-trans isomerase
MCLALASPATCLAQDPTAASSSTGDYPAQRPAEDLAPYAAIGSAIADSIQLNSAHWSEAQFGAFLSGVRASYNGHGFPLDARSEHMLEEMTEQQRESQTSPYSPNPQQARVEQYMAHARQGLGMQQTDSGLLFRVVTRGAGPRPRPDDTVVINIAAKGPDGATDLPQLSAHQLRIKVRSVFPGLAEGLQLLALGGKALFIMPPKLTFGDGRWPDGVDRGSPIWLEVELADIAPQ